MRPKAELNYHSKLKLGVRVHYFSNNFNFFKDKKMLISF